MRTETKIALALFAVAVVLGHFLPIPEFFRGFIVGLSLTGMAITFISDRIYEKLKVRRTAKINGIKKFLHKV